MTLIEKPWCSAVFRIISEKKSIEEICDIMKVEPTRYHKKGELQSKRDPKSKKREENIWILKSSLDEHESLQSHIEHLISFVKDYSDSIKVLMQECEFDIMCAYSSGDGQGGFTLDHKLLLGLTFYPIDLSISLYPPSIGS